MIENRLHVLVVDDDPTVRRSLERILSADSRLEVVQAEDGLAALRILESRPIDILISDESMPQINGVRLLQTVRARWPGTRRVLYTGHPHADVVLEAINRGGVDKALMKGVPLEQLRMELAEVVDECLAQVLGRTPAGAGATTIAAPVRSDAGQPRVLVVAAEPAVATAFGASLRHRGFEASSSSSPEEALRELEIERADVVVLDLGRPEVDCSRFIRSLRAFDLDCPVVVTAPRSDLPRALEAIREGAYRYLVHPVRDDALATVVRQAALLRRVAELRRRALVEADEQAAWQVGDRAALEVRFRHALDRLFMVYQPIVSWSQRKIIGYEALVRSAEPALPHPGALFDAATRLDRVAELSRRIRALSPAPFTAAARPDDAPLLFMNVHVTDLDADDFVEGPLASLAPSVALEITERAALDSLDSVAARVSELRARGYRVAIDDLGAGYAGLSSFALLEPHIVKIDMSLVRNIHTAPLKQRLVVGLTEACADLGVWLVAEGVETRDERDALLALGCDIFQGYLFARPGKGLPEPVWE